MDVIDRTFLPIYYAYNLDRFETNADCVLDWFSKTCWERVIFAKGCVGKLKWFFEDIAEKSIKKLDELVNTAFTENGINTFEKIPHVYAYLRRLLLTNVPFLQSFYHFDKHDDNVIYMSWEPLSYAIEEWQEFESWSKTTDYSFFDRQSNPTT